MGEGAPRLPGATSSHPSRVDSSLLSEAGSCCFCLSCLSDKNLVMLLSPRLWLQNNQAHCMLYTGGSCWHMRWHPCTACVPRVTLRCWLSCCVPPWACCGFMHTRAKDLLWWICLENQLNATALWRLTPSERWSPLHSSVPCTPESWPRHHFSSQPSLP